MAQYYPSTMLPPPPPPPMARPVAIIRSTGESITLLLIRRGLELITLLDCHLRGEYITSGKRVEQNRGRVTQSTRTAHVLRYDFGSIRFRKISRFHAIRVTRRPHLRMIPHFGRVQHDRESSYGKRSQASRVIFTD